MNTKPLSPKAHGIIDYVFSGIQLAAPVLIGMNKDARRTYQALGTAFTAVNAFSDTPVGIKKAIPFRGHQKADLGFLSGLALLTATSFIRKDKKALLFHVGFLAITLTNYLLTDYKARS